MHATCWSAVQRLPLPDTEACTTLRTQACESGPLARLPPGVNNDRAASCTSTDTRCRPNPRRGIASGGGNGELASAMKLTTLRAPQCVSRADYCSGKVIVPLLWVGPEDFASCIRQGLGSSNRIRLTPLHLVQPGPSLANLGPPRSSVVECRPTSAKTRSKPQQFGRSPAKLGRSRTTFGRVHPNLVQFGEIAPAWPGLGLSGGDFD